MMRAVLMKRKLSKQSARIETLDGEKTYLGRLLIKSTGLAGSILILDRHALETSLQCSCGHDVCGRLVETDGMIVGFAI